MPNTPYLSLLRNHIDFTRAPFSDRGSRLLVFQEPGKSRLMVKLVERLVSLDPDIEAYLHRPPFIRDLALVDENGEALEFETMSHPNVLYFRTRLGEFGLVFQDRRTISIGLPPQVKAGVRFHVQPEYWGMGRSGGYTVNIIVNSEADGAIALTIHPGNEAPEEILPFTIANVNAETRWEEWFSRHYDPNTMWRGPVWANINYFFVEALNQVGEHDLANDLRTRTLDLINSHRNIYEFYNGETGEAPPKAADIFGWTAAVFIDLAIRPAGWKKWKGQKPQHE